MRIFKVILGARGVINERQQHLYFAIFKKISYIFATPLQIKQHIAIFVNVVRQLTHITWIGM
jgi:hypothetical protein